MATTAIFPSEDGAVATVAPIAAATLVTGFGAQNFAATEADLVAAPGLGLNVAVAIQTNNFAVVSATLGFNAAVALTLKKTSGTIVVVCT